MYKKIDKEKLDKMKHPELKAVAEKLEMKQLYRYKKDELRQEIINKVREFEKFEERELGKYKRIEKMGNPGKDATTYLVSDNKTNKKYALKQYRKNKSTKNILKEVEFQKKAATYGISPKIIDISEYYKFTVMDKLDVSLFELLKETKGKLSEELQQNIIDIVYVLDKIKIFHADPNPGNFMIKKGKRDKMYIIDFGFSRDIDSKVVRKYGTEKVNQKFMIVGLLLKIKEICGNINLNRYKVLKKHLSPQDKELFSL